MPGSKGIRFGSLGDHWVHLCVDMQRMFADQTPWATPWLHRILPMAITLVDHAPERTVFTRFIPRESPQHASGTWRRYYERWPEMTLERIDRDLIEVVPELARFAPPARVFDKQVYSPWSPALHAYLSQAHVDTLVVSGAETEVCVLATVLGAIDRGYRTIVATDAICSSADETHDSMMTIYHSRFGMQVETAEVAEIIEAAP